MLLLRGRGLLRRLAVLGWAVLAAGWDWAGLLVWTRRRLPTPRPLMQVHRRRGPPTPCRRRAQARSCWPRSPELLAAERLDRPPVQPQPQPRLHLGHKPLPCSLSLSREWDRVAGRAHLRLHLQLVAQQSRSMWLLQVSPVAPSQPAQVQGLRVRCQVVAEMPTAVVEPHLLHRISAPQWLQLMQRRCSRCRLQAKLLLVQLRRRFLACSALPQRRCSCTTAQTRRTLLVRPWAKRRQCRRTRFQALQALLLQGL